MRTLLLLAALPLLAQQQLVVDRHPASASSAQKIETVDGGFLGDAFQVGKSGEIWFIDAVRVWGAPDQPASCPAQLGDRYSKITFLGALDNPPVPGVPLCDCHALTGLVIAPLTRGTSKSPNQDFKAASANGLWQIDFPNLKWSVPGGMDVVFSVRAEGIPKAACGKPQSWALSASPAPGNRLHTMNNGAVPTGLVEESRPHRFINIQVWAHKVQ